MRRTTYLGAYLEEGGKGKAKAKAKEQWIDFIHIHARMGKEKSRMGREDQVE